MEKSSITVYDIARMAGVSTSTVSRVLNGNVKVSAEKEKRVREIVEKYHFTLNPLAQSFFRQKTNNIGVIMPDIRSAFYSTLFVECEKAVAAKGYNMILCNTMNNQKAEIDHIASMSQQKVDIILQVGGGADEVVPNPEYVRQINIVHQKTPIIITNDLKGTDCYHIVADDENSMNQVLDYLFDLGHRAIAIVGGWRTIMPTARKWDAFRKYMRLHGIPVYEPWIIEADYSSYGGYHAIETIMKLDKKPTAIIAINDEVGFGAIEAAKEMGLSIPADFSIVGFDNTNFSTFTSPKLTTVDYNFDLFVNKLLEIIERIGEHEYIKTKTFEGKLIIRESCKALT